MRKGLVGLVYATIIGTVVLFGNRSHAQNWTAAGLRMMKESPEQASATYMETFHRANVEAQMRDQLNRIEEQTAKPQVQQEQTIQQDNSRDNPNNCRVLRPDSYVRDGKEFPNHGYKDKLDYFSDTPLKVFEDHTTWIHDGFWTWHIYQTRNTPEFLEELKNKKHPSYELLVSRIEQINDGTIRFRRDSAGLENFMPEPRSQPFIRDSDPKENIDYESVRARKFKDLLSPEDKILVLIRGSDWGDVKQHRLLQEMSLLVCI